MAKWNGFSSEGRRRRATADARVDLGVREAHEGAAGAGGGVTSSRV
jgi:hypothetical protein